MGRLATVERIYMMESENPINLKVSHSDEELMRDYIQGNTIAFEELANRYEKAIYNFAYQHFRNIAQSEDITQDVFVRIVESKDKYDPDRPFKPWIYQVARNRIYDELRKKKRWSLIWSHSNNPDNESREIESKPNGHSTPRDNANRSELDKLVLDAVRLLDSRSKDLIVLRYLQDLPVKEVAEIMGIPEGTVQSTTHRALKKLEKILHSKNIKPEDLV